MPLIQRGWRASPGAQISDRGKSFTVTHPHTYLFVFALWKEILKQSQCPAEDDGWDFHPAALPTNHGGCTLERTDSDGRCSGHRGNAKTDGPLLDSSSSNSLWEEERGQRSQPPKVHTAGEEEMLSQLSERNQDTVALT